MAKEFQEVFGKMLVVAPLDSYEMHLPSPEQLKRKIIIKGKKIYVDKSKLSSNSANNSPPETFRTTSQRPEEDAIISGKMYLETPTATGNEWQPFYFTLKKNKLEYTEIRQAYNQGSGTHSPNRGPNLDVEELHENQIWFHGKISGGTDEALERVRNFNVEGGFLVKNSDTIPRTFTVCFLSGGKTQNLRIKMSSENGQNNYYFLEKQKFDNLYSLISYYQIHPLETKIFRLERFTTPVPMPETHIDKPWFYDDVDRMEAENIFRHIACNGCFLVRYSKNTSSRWATSRFAISFKADNEIKHCRIRSDGRILVVSNQRFDDIVQLVDYYQLHPFYKGIRLKHPVTPELRETIARSGETLIPADAECGEGYWYNDEPTVLRVRARGDYNAPVDRPDCLSFKMNDIITNVIRTDDDGWWTGDLGDEHQKFFPSQLVEEIESDKVIVRSCPTSTVELGRVEVVENPNSPNPYILKIHGSPSPFRAAVSSKREADEWAEHLNLAAIAAGIVTPSKTSVFRDCLRHVSKALFQTKGAEKSGISKDFSKLIVYCCTVPRLPPEEIIRLRRLLSEGKQTGQMLYTLMFSFTETAAKRLMGKDAVFYVYFHQLQLSRVYPNGKRWDSSNYLPILYWNSGCQMVSLNFQTPDKSMQLNHGRFLDNGCCGYVLRPDYMFSRNDFDPNDTRLLRQLGIPQMKISITVIAARFLSKEGNKSMTGPFVEIETFGADFDSLKQRTRSYEAADNGLSPVWSDKFDFTVRNPDLALIRFSVHDEDFFGDANFLGQATYPVRRLRQGYRSIPLKNGFGDELSSVLLIRFSCTLEPNS